MILFELSLSPVSFGVSVTAWNLLPSPSTAAKKLAGQMEPMDWFIPYVWWSFLPLHAMWDLFAKFSDVLGTWKIILWHCGHPIRLFQAFVLGLNRSWCILRWAVVWWQFSSVLQYRCLSVSLFRLIRTEFETLQYCSWWPFGTRAFHWQIPNGAIWDCLTITDCCTIACFMTTAVDAGRGGVSTFSAACISLPTISDKHY